jgi:hypothetical protein
MQFIFRKANIELILEIGPQGTAAYLAECDTGKFVGSINDLTKIFQYRAILEKGTKLAKTEYFEEKELLVYNRVMGFLTSDKPVVEVPTEIKMSLRPYVDYLDNVEANLEKAQSIPEHIDDKEYRDQFILQCNSAKHVLQHTMTNIAKSGKAETSKEIISRLLKETALPIWCYNKLTLSRATLGVDILFRSFYFPSNHQKGINMTVAELRDKKIASACKLLISDSKMLITILRDVDLVSAIVPDLTTEDLKTIEQSRVNLVPPSSVLKELIKKMASLTYKPELLTVPYQRMTASNFIPFLNAFMARFPFLATSPRLLDEEIDILFDPAIYKPHECFINPVTNQLGKAFVNDDKDYGILKVIRGDLSRTLFVTLFMRYLRISVGSTVGIKLITKFKSKETQASGLELEPLNVLAEAPTYDFTAALTILQPITDPERKKISVQIEKIRGRDPYVNMKAPSRRSSPLTDTSWNIILEISALYGPGIATPLARYLETLDIEVVQTEVAHLIRARIQDYVPRLKQPTLPSV